MFQSPEPQFQMPPRQQARQAQPVRQSRNDRYLPPMPEMLRPVDNQPEMQPRYAQGSPKNPSPSKPASNQGVLVRAQADDDRQPQSGNLVPAAKLLMPSPEELGLAYKASPANPGSADWTAARQRLDAFGASYYRLERAEGGFRFVCCLPYSGDAQRERHFEALGASEADAIRLALEQVEQWKTGSR